MRARARSPLVRRSFARHDRGRTFVLRFRSLAIVARARLLNSSPPGDFSARAHRQSPTSPPPFNELLLVCALCGGEFKAAAVRKDATSKLLFAKLFGNKTFGGAHARECAL